MTTIPAPALALRLTDILGGTFTNDEIHVGGHVITSRPNGDVILDGSVRLGSHSEGPDLLAARYRMEVSG